MVKSIELNDEDYDLMEKITTKTYTVVRDTDDIVPIGRIVAAILPIDDSKKKFRVQFAYCSPKDQFDKKRGQQIAILRLLSHKHPIEFERVEGESLFETIKTYIIKDSYRKDVRWCRGLSPEELK